MKIIFSPTKSQNTSSSEGLFDQGKILFPEKHDQLQKYLQQLSEKDIARIFKTSPKKTKEVFALIKKPPRPVSAIDLFSGTSFSRLCLGQWSQGQISYVAEHLCILSAYYGVLHPGDQISAYRLDMLDRILPINSGFKNLYDFWGEQVAEYFSEIDTIINLASSEYSKILSKKQQKNMISIHFLVEKNDALKSISVYAKQQRGEMLEYMINREITNPLDLQKYSCDGFVFNPEKSDSNNYYFIKSV